MTNASIARALVSLRDERDRLSVRLVEVQAELADLERAILAVEGVVHDGRRRDSGCEAGLGRVARRRGKRSVREVVLDVLADVPGRAWTRQQLVAHLRQSGIDQVADLPGSVSNALTALRRDGYATRDDAGRWSGGRRLRLADTGPSDPQSGRD